MRHAPLALALALALTGCPGSDEDGGGGIGRVDDEALIKVVTADEPRVLDPHVTSNGGDVKVMNQVYETLLVVDPDDVTKLKPELAESWEIGADGKTITFQVREGVQFHDGALLDAAACKLSLERVREVGWDLASAPYAPEYHHITGVAADGMTLTVELDSPVARVVLRNLSMFPASVVSPKVLEAAQGMDPDAATDFVTKEAAGTGPFTVDAFDPAAKVIRLLANPDYWGGAPAVKTLVFEPVKDKSTRWERVEKAEGAIVCDAVPRERWPEVEAAEDLVLHDWWALNLCYVGLNGEHEKTEEKDLRRAIQLALDREAIAEHYQGTARPTYSLVPRSSGEYDPELRVVGWEEDLAARRERARKLVERAGAAGRSLTIYFPRDERPYLPKPQSTADAVRQQLEEIGLDVDIQEVENSVLFSSVATNKYELTLVGWMSDNGDPDNFYAPLADGAAVGQPGENNSSRIVDGVVHGKLAEARTLVDAAERTTAYREVEQRLQDEVAGYVPLLNAKQAIIHSAGIEGLEIDPLGHYRFDGAKLR